MACEAADAGQCLNRRKFVAALGVATAWGHADAQEVWRPTGPVKLVVPYPPGGSADILIRLIAPGLGERLGQPVVVENKGGATGSIGSGHVYAAAADGMTLLVGLSDPLSIYPHLIRTTYDATKFVPVASIGSTPFVLLARPDLPASNLQELIQLARRQSLSYANAGIGGSIHMTTLEFARAARVDNLLHVPFTGMSPALQALMGSQVDVMFCAVGGTTQYRSRLKFLGVTASERVAAIAEVPTFQEQGLPLVKELWMGVLAPPRTPAGAATRLAAAIEEIVATPAYRAKAEELAMRTQSMNRGEFAGYYLDEYRKWGEVARAANVKLD
ncbi:tripartite tricarboxylate transporter substrate binding protein [Xylophilus sp. GW821-FHT01B05]